LTVGEVEVWIKQRDTIVVVNCLAVHDVLVNLTAPRVASRTHLDFTLRAVRAASLHVA
jgi:hypothetical protein